MLRIFRLFLKGMAAHLEFQKGMELFWKRLRLFASLKSKQRTGDFQFLINRPRPVCKLLCAIWVFFADLLTCFAMPKFQSSYVSTLILYFVFLHSQILFPDNCDFFGVGFFWRNAFRSQKH